MRVRLAALAANFAVQKIPRVELYSRLCGQNFQYAAGAGIGNARRQRQAVARAIQNKVVVVAPAEFNLLVIGVDARPNGCGLAEVKWSAFDLPQFAGGNQRVVHRSEPVGVDLNLVLQDVALALAGEIEVRVVGEIQHRVFVGGRGVVDLQLVRVGQRVGHFRGQLARIALLAIRADVGQLQRRRILGG